VAEAAGKRSLAAVRKALSGVSPGAPGWLQEVAAALPSQVTYPVYFGVDLAVSPARAKAQDALRSWPRQAFWCMFCWCGTGECQDPKWRECPCCHRLWRRLDGRNSINQGGKDARTGSD
jgi:hypothetical protein